MYNKTINMEQYQVEILLIEDNPHEAELTILSLKKHHLANKLMHIDDGAEALDYLEADHQFLLKGDVFTRDFLEMWVSHKRKEHDALRLRPHPYEFFLYYDC